jgi:hypothetical protein
MPPPHKADDGSNPHGFMVNDPSAHTRSGEQGSLQFRQRAADLVSLQYLMFQSLPEQETDENPLPSVSASTIRPMDALFLQAE